MPSYVSADSIINRSISSIHYLDRMGKLTAEQREEFKQAFEVLDADGDGRITGAELRNIMKKFGANPSEQEISAIIKGVDQDNSGTIELPEFLDFLDKVMTDKPGDEADEMRQVFKMFDLNNDGLITKDELRAGLSKLGERLSEAEVDALMEDADIDGDGNINYEEFVEMLSKKQ